MSDKEIEMLSLVASELRDAVRHGIVIHLGADTSRLLHELIRSLRCDAIGECGLRCDLRAGHPGEIHERTEHGTVARYRLVGSVLSHSDV